MKRLEKEDQEDQEDQEDLDQIENLETESGPMMDRNSLGQGRANKKIQEVLLRSTLSIFKHL